jgi:hypothetical protein
MWVNRNEKYIYIMDICTDAWNFHLQASEVAQSTIRYSGVVYKKYTRFFRFYSRIYHFGAVEHDVNERENRNVPNQNKRTSLSVLQNNLSVCRKSNTAAETFYTKHSFTIFRTGMSVVSE